MAKKGFSLNFDGFLDLARELSELGEDVLIKAVDNAFTASKDYVNNEVEKAMNVSRYNFDGTGYSQGKAKASLQEVAAMPVEWNGTVATANIGVRNRDALEVLFLAYGTPHITADTKLLNAIKVKGKVKKEVERIQKDEFNKVIEEALNNG